MIVSLVQITNVGFRSFLWPFFNCKRYFRGEQPTDAANPQILDDAAVNGALAAVTGSDNSDVRRQRTLGRSVAAAR